jgi:hypothetical protein
MAPLLQVVLRGLHDEREDLVLEVTTAEPDEEPLGQGVHLGAHLGTASSYLVDVAAADAREDGGVRKLEVGYDQATEALPVRPCQAGELLVVGLRPHRREVGEHAGVVLSEPRLLRRLR